MDLLSILILVIDNLLALILIIFIFIHFVRSIHGCIYGTEREGLLCWNGSKLEILGCR